MKKILEILNYCISKLKEFVNNRPRLRCYIYSVIASCFEGRMAEFLFIDYIYYISCNVVESVIRKHPRYFFGAFFRKHVNKLTLRGFILREFLISYLMILLVELNQAEWQKPFIEKHKDPIVVIRYYLNKAFICVYNYVVSFLTMNRDAIARNIIKYYNFIIT